MRCVRKMEIVRTYLAKINNKLFCFG